ncbi:copper resistance CopC family protein, partial [Kineosporia sp. R_H_3]|uniref:copper resistance CopC family protein n=1 Tax=Kineosporia sp. R_H_3 TaxID=1961848 RepID=UPI001E4611AD
MTPGSSVSAVRPSVRMSLRAVTAVALALLAVCATATAGSAHARLTGTDPEDGARMKATPDTVTLTFSDPLDREFVRVRLTGPGDAVLPVAPRVEAGTVTFTVPSKLPGTYSVAFRVVSKDGHPVSGTLSFVVTGAPPVSPSLDATATPTDTGTATTSPAPTPTPTAT